MTLSENIRQALSNKDIQDSKELSNMLNNYKKKLDKGKAEYIVSAKLSNSISEYLLTHKFHAPKELMDLNKTLEKTNKKHNGFAAITNWMTH